MDLKKYKTLTCTIKKLMNEGVVSKETVVLRRWGSSIQKFGFINGVDNVNWPPYRELQLLESLYGGQFTLSTPLIKPNFCIKKLTVFHLETWDGRYFNSQSSRDSPVSSAYC